MRTFFSFLKNSFFFFLLLGFALPCRSEEIQGYEAQAKIAQSIMLQAKRWETGIKDWSGRVHVHRKSFMNQELYADEEYEIDFYYDFIGKRHKTVENQLSMINYNLKPIYRSLEKDVRLAVNGTWYQYRTFSHMPQEPQDERVNYVNILTVASEDRGMLPPFEPLRTASWPEGLKDIVPLFYTFEKSEQTKKKMMEYEKWPEERVDVYLADLWTNGSSIMTFRREGSLITTRAFDVRSCTYDASQDYMPVAFADDMGNPRSWTCERQRVGGFWIPKTLHIIRSYQDGSLYDETMTWTNQKVNEGIPESEFSPVSLGIRQGQECYDYRTDSLYDIEGSEYPPPEARRANATLPLPVKLGWFRLSCMVSGAVLAVLGGIGLIRRRWKGLPKNYS